MATTDLTTVTDQEARMRVFQIIGSDIYPEAPAAFTGDWHQALRKTAAHWAPPTRRQRIARRLRHALHLAA